MLPEGSAAGFGRTARASEPLGRSLPAACRISLQRTPRSGVRFDRQRVARADRDTTDLDERQSVITSAGKVLAEAGPLDESDALPTVEPKRSHSPCCDIGLASNAGKRDTPGRKIAAIGWAREVFVSGGDYPHCHRFAPILKRFEQEFGFTVLAISMDGRAIPEYPNARPARPLDKRLIARLFAATLAAAPLAIRSTTKPRATFEDD